MKWKLLTLGLVWLIVLSACGGSGGSVPATSASTNTPVPATPMPASTVKIEGALLTHDDGNGNPGEIAMTFKPSDRSIHAVVKLDKLEPDLKVKFSWVAVAAAGSINQTIAGQDFSELTSTTLYGIITMPTDWPTGKYRLEIYLNGRLAQSIDYTVA